MKIEVRCVDLLSTKELAVALKRSESYVKQMKRRGFRMVGGRTTLRDALGWLARNPRPFTDRNHLDVGI